MLVVTFFGCGSVDEKTQIKNLFVDAVCNYTKKIRDNIDKLDTADSNGMKEIKTANDQLNNEMEKLPQKYGYNDEQAFQAVLKTYEDDKAFEQEVLTSIKDTCGYYLESLDAL